MIQSLRIRLALWYVGVAVVAGVLLVVLGAQITYQLISHNARLSLATAARDVPELVALYEARAGSLREAAPLIQEHFDGTGIDAIVVPFDGPPLSRPPMAWFPPPPFLTHGQNQDQVIAVNPGFGPGLGPGPQVREHYFFSYFPSRFAVERIPVNGGFVFLHTDPTIYRTADNYIRAAVIGFFTLGLILAWLAADAVARHVLEPLTRTTDALNRFGDGDFTPEPVTTNDRSELGNLARAYNRAVAEIMRALSQRAKAEAEMRQFVADAGHQLRTPLTVVMGHLSTYSARTANEKDQRIIGNMLRESRRMRGLIEDLILLARLEDDADASDALIDAGALVTRLAESFQGNGFSNVTVTEAAPGIIAGRESEIYGALSSLVDNALKYAPGSAIELTARIEDGMVEIAVADRGSGMSESELEHAFDRFYRGEAQYTVSGSGLGLAIVRRIVERASGTIDLANRPGGGLICGMRFPLATPAIGYGFEDGFGEAM